MDETDFQLLTILNDTHNITKTADILFMTQSAVSRRISTLELELGAHLITRTRQGISFTPEGETVLASALSATSLLEQMRLRLRQQQGIISGTLNLGVTNNLAAHMLPTIMEQYHQRYPYVNVNIITDHSRKITRRLAEGEIVVGFARGEQDWTDGQLLIKTEPVYLIRRKEDKDKPLAGLPYIHRLTSQQRTRNINKWLHENNLPGISSNIATEHIFSAVRMVEIGLGWTIVPEIALKDFQGDATPLFYRDGTPMLHKTWLLYYQQNLTLPAVKAFVDLVHEMYNPQD